MTNEENRLRNGPTHCHLATKIREKQNGGWSVVYAAMEDLRVLWIRDRVYAALGLQEESLFRELLQRNGSQILKELLAYLDQPAQQQYSSAVLFHVREEMVEQEIEDMEGKIETKVRPVHCLMLCVCAMQSNWVRMSQRKRMQRKAASKDLGHLVK